MTELPRSPAQVRCGLVCESTDSPARDRRLPEPCAGDLLALRSTPERVRGV